MVEDPASAVALDFGFAALREAERGYILRRRGVVAFPDAGVVGLALSGGGIRSATFCLGFLQTLSARGLVPGIDYLSTVSGGSYIGSFFGSLFVPAGRRGDCSDGIASPTFDPNHPLQCPRGEEAVRRLRDMGRYLTPSGTSDAFFGGAIVARNWVAVQFVIGMAALLLFWLVHGADRLLTPDKPPSHWFGRVLAHLGSALPTLPMTATLELCAVASLGVTLACGNAYWLTRRDLIPGRRVVRVASNSVVWAFLLLFAYAMTPWADDRLLGDWTPPRADFTGFVAFVSGLAIVLIIVAEARYGRLKVTRAARDDADMRADEMKDKQRAIAAEDAVRAALSRWMALALTLTLTFTGFAVIDWIGHMAYRSAQLLQSQSERPHVDVWSELKNAWPILVTVFPPVASFVASRGLKNRRPPTDPGDVDTRASWAPTVIVLLGAFTVAVWLVFWSAAALAVAKHLEHIPGAWSVVLALLVALNIGQSLCFSFINLSSLSTFYAARLRRAYIGASSYGNSRTSVRADDPQDTIRIHDYYEGGIDNGAPLHLINVTIAETIAGGSNLIARDRKGKPMHLSPAGLAYEGDTPGTVHARLRGANGEQSQGEELPLANWVAISGAAVSAAIGSGTSLGTSIIATMANVRLGYWWRNTLAHGVRGAFWADARDTVQNYLFLELRGKFAGTARSRWYLTDGGHFENTGVYPLLQRRVPFIIACDNGADPHYLLEDVMRLIGRARTDLGVKLDFLDSAALAEKLGARSPIARAVGTLADMRRHGSPAEPGGPIAALATIDYGKDETGKVLPPGLLLLVKPRVAFTEPPELLAYQRRQPAFPQQTTGDQYFDEEQWEAYRRLGELSGERLFPEARASGMTGWLPSDEMAFDQKAVRTATPAAQQSARSGLHAAVSRIFGRG